MARRLLLNASVAELTVENVLTPAQTAKLKDQYLDDTYATFPPITTSTLARDEKDRFVFLYLRGMLNRAHYERAWEAVQKMKFNDAKRSRRNALKKSGGRELNFGWADRPHRLRLPKRILQLAPPGYKRQHNIDSYAPTRHQWAKYAELIPLIDNMDKWFYRYLPDAWTTTNYRGKLRSYQYLRATGHSSFSTLTLLKSAPTSVHRDSNNADAGLTCLTTFGEFEGGDLLFPQYGIKVVVQPGDLIIAATHREWHCNVRPLTGTRYSLIGYFREGLINGRHRRPS
jgi:hypothetical protein